MARKNRFRSDVQRAYRLICEKGLIDDGELQYVLDVGSTSFYRIRRSLLALFPDIIHERGWFKLIKEGSKFTPSVIDHWGDLEPQKQIVVEKD